jgi:hypothetical protein
MAVPARFAGVCSGATDRAKSQNKSGRETRKTKSAQASGKKLPRYLRESGEAHVEIPAYKPSKKSPPAN